jgi:adenosylcobinamide-GDP ribazoletransferase
MNKLLFAFQFLTIFPLRMRKAPDADVASGSTIFFPIVGLFLGLILVGLTKIFSYYEFDILLTCAILVVVLFLMTGGLHLDGVADTFDGLGSLKDKESILKIMRDSHIGTMGVLGLISVILLKVTILNSLESGILGSALILMCVISRWSMTLAIWMFPYAREEGKGKEFFTGMNFIKALLALIVTLAIAFYVYRTVGIIMVFIAGIFVVLFGKFVKGKIGGITGDTLGAMNELTEVLVLLSFCFVQKFLWRII